MIYQKLFWLLSEAIIFGSIGVAFVALYTIKRINRRCINKKNAPYGGAEKDTTNSSSYTSFEPTTPLFSYNTKLWRISKLITQIYVYFALGLALVLSVGFEQIPWAVGAILLSLLYSFILANVLRNRSSDNEGLEREELLADESGKKVESLAVDNHTQTSNQTKLTLQERYIDFKKWLEKYLISLKDTIMANKKIFAIGVVVILVVSFTSSLSTDCLCVAANPVELSSKWSRSVQKSVCDGRALCHLYITMADSSTDLIVNFHTTQKFSSVVAYDTVSHSGEGQIGAYANTSRATSFKMDNIVEEDRYVHWAELRGLTPDASYYFVIELSDNSDIVEVTQEHKVRTIPENDDSVYNFISGGDMSADDNVVTLQQFAAARNPYFAMVGGDVAYDNAFVYCYRRWDTWFDYWYQHMKTPDGYMIPALLAVGNHEAGGFGQYGKSTPFFTAYFPQQLGLQNVDPFNRVLYHTHKIGKRGIVVILDSDVITSMADQMDFIDASFALANAEHRNAKFVIYHATIYATVPTFAKAMTADGKKHWTPLFDKHNVTVVFENHLHCYKRTYPLRDDKISTVEEGGVVYLGDGSWGVDPRLIPATYSWYTEIVEKKQHVFLVTVNATYLSTEAVGMDGKSFDSWARYLP